MEVLYKSCSILWEWKYNLQVGLIKHVLLIVWTGELVYENMDIAYVTVDMLIMIALNLQQTLHRINTHNQIQIRIRV